MPKAEVQIPAFVSIIETSPRPITDKPSVRIRQEESLSHEVLFTNLNAQLVGTVQVYSSRGQSEVSGFNVFSPYTNRGIHTMLVDSTARYMPTPTEFSDEEFEALMRVARVVVDEIRKNDERQVIAIGWNNTPLNIGKAEVDSHALQTMITKYHLHIWGRPDTLTQKPFSELPQAVQEFIKGDPFCRFAALVAKGIVKDMNSPYVDGESLDVGSQALRGKFIVDLPTAFSSPRRFARFLKDLHSRLEEATIAVWDATSAVPYQAYEFALQEMYEGRGTLEMHEFVSSDPALRSLEERRKLLSEIFPDSIPAEFLPKIRHLNAFLKNRDETTEKKWIFKGMGYALAITQHPDEPVARFYIRPAILIPHQGGLVESQDLSLVRKTDGLESTEEIERNKQDIARLRAALPDAIYFNAVPQE